MNARAARQALHSVFSLYIVLGWLVPDCRLRAVHFGVCVLTVLHWWTNNGRCFLSQYDYEHSGGYTASWLRAVGLDTGDNRALQSALAYVVVLLPAWLSYVRLRRGCGW